ncbi:hypothetical protein ACQ4LE_002469 [Meloidogyne hapla]
MRYISIFVFFISFYVVNSMLGFSGRSKGNDNPNQFKGNERTKALNGFSGGTQGKDNQNQQENKDYLINKALGITNFHEDVFHLINNRALNLDGTFKGSKIEEHYARIKAMKNEDLNNLPIDLNNSPPDY